MEEIAFTIDGVTYEEDDIETLEIVLNSLREQVKKRDGCGKEFTLDDYPFSGPLENFKCGEKLCGNKKYCENCIPDLEDKNEVKQE